MPEALQCLSGRRCPHIRGGLFFDLKPATDGEDRDDLFIVVAGVVVDLASKTTTVGPHRSTRSQCVEHGPARCGQTPSQLDNGISASATPS